MCVIDATRNFKLSIESVNDPGIEKLIAFLLAAFLCFSNDKVLI